MLSHTRPFSELEKGALFTTDAFAQGLPRADELENAALFFSLSQGWGDRFSSCIFTRPSNQAASLSMLPAYSGHTSHPE